MPKQIKYVDFGITDAKSFFIRVAYPNAMTFEAEATVQSAINAVWGLWHLHEWYWHDIYPRENTRNNHQYDAFVQQLFVDCPELKYLQDIADAAKHRGISKPSNTVAHLITKSGQSGAGGYNIPSGGYGEGAIAYASAAKLMTVHFIDKSDPCQLSDLIHAVTDYWSRRLG